MKKLTLIFFLLAVTIAQAQTKEETINWLQEKLTSFFNRHKVIRGVQINECELKITYDNYEETMPIKGAILVDMKYYYDKSYKQEGAGIVARYNYNAVKIYRDGKISYTSQSSLFCDLTEPDIKNRLQKAFDHLATFCSQKKEAF